MNHVIESLEQWLTIYKETYEESKHSLDKKAVVCIENAMKELQKYYKSQVENMLSEQELFEKLKKSLEKSLDRQVTEEEYAELYWLACWGEEKVNVFLKMFNELSKN